MKPYDKNPRKISDKAVFKVANSIKAFGWQQPIVVDRHGSIIAGHTRYKAAQSLGITDVPVKVAEGLSDDEVKAYRLADNRTAEESRWDLDLLGTELRDLDLDLSLTGFDPRELLALTGPTTGLGDEDDVPEAPDSPKSKPGDLWLCGPHRVLCGDSTSADDVARLLGDCVPHLMVTDPPYGVDYDASWRNGIRRENGTIVSARAVGAVTNDHNADWGDAWALFPGDVAYIWHASSGTHIVAGSLEVSGFDLRSLIIWAKNHIVIGRGHYHQKHEPCWYAVRKGAKGSWTGSRKESTVWNIDKPMKSETGHSTQKPVECMRRPMANNSKPSDAVYDPFLGSGTSLIAAETTGRVCYGLELEPKYVDVIVSRWETFTGQEAVLDGKE